MLEGDAGIFKNRERSERFTLFHALINCENTFPLHFLDKRGCCLVKGSQEKTAIFFKRVYGHRTCHRLFMLPQGKLRRSQFSQKSSLCFSFCHFIFCGCSVNEPFAEYLRSHGRKNTLLDVKGRSETLKRKDISFLKDVISLYSLPHCVVCHPAICPSQAEFRSHCCSHTSNLVRKIVRSCFFLGQTMKI